MGVANREESPGLNLGVVTQRSTLTSIHPLEPRLRNLATVGSNAVGGMLGLPRATTRYTVRRVRVPMRDGIDLVADHYAPTTSSPAGTLLVRGPYGRGFPFSLLYGALYAARGYRVLLQSVRGTFGSGGIFQPMVHEAADGADTVAWLVRQPWCDGRVATMGLSYAAHTQMGIGCLAPPGLAAQFLEIGRAHV